MRVKIIGIKLITGFTLLLLPANIVVCQTAKDLVAGNLIQFSENGGWCWYQDERVVLDTLQNKLIMGFDESSAGYGGSPRNGVVAAVVFDLNHAVPVKYDLAKFGCDDHNTPGIYVRPDGKYLAMYAEHYDYYNSRYRIFDGSAWAAEQRFDWQTIPGGTDYTIAYSNLYYLSSENRLYDFARANHRSPNFLVSYNHGDTWNYGGQLTTNTSSSYNKGYYKYWGNGSDRIDFIFTEQHPRDTSTSIYHGYIKNGKSYASDGSVADENIFNDTHIPAFWNFTKVFADNTVINGIAMRRCWNTDVVRYKDGTIATIVTARDNNNTGGGDNAINPDHSFVYCRYDGTNWSYTYLGKAGLKLYSSEQDYTGLAAVHPFDPDVIYISTSYDPSDGTSLNGIREIFKGVTNDQGVSWSWTPITRNSVRDNIRPVVPIRNSDNTALLWMRGTYNTAQSFNMAIVGIIESKSESYRLMEYADADLSNTTLSDGRTLIPTGPDASPGNSDNLWHLRTGYGNGGSVLTSAETGGENAPALKTTVRVPAQGIYDVWVNFWADPTADWRIKAGLSADQMRVFRQMANKQVEPGDHSTSITLNSADNIFLYQAYLGRSEVTEDSLINVYVDDECIQTGTQSTRIGNTARTWYDGISYAVLSSLSVSSTSVELDDSANSAASVDVIANTAWKISILENWLHVSPDSGMNDGTLIINAEKNATDSIRSAFVTILSAGSESVIISVTQLPAAPLLTVSPPELHIPSSAGETGFVTIYSNTKWTVASSESWLRPDQLSGTKSAQITLISEENKSFRERTAVLTITASGLAPQQVVVSQEAQFELEVSDTILALDAAAGSTGTFSITSNVQWSLLCGAAWLTIAPDTGSGNAIVTITASENQDRTDRSALIILLSPGLTSSTITATQLANAATSVSVCNPDGINAFPNPVMNKISITFPTSSAKLLLSTLDGIIVMSANLESSPAEIDLTAYKTGLYLLKIVSSEKTAMVRIIKK